MAKSKKSSKKPSIKIEDLEPEADPTGGGGDLHSQLQQMASKAAQASSVASQRNQLVRNAISGVRGSK